MGAIEPIVNIMVGDILKFVLWVLVPLLVMTAVFGKVLFRLPKPLRAIVYLAVGYGFWFLFVQYGI